jgi:poly(beta-D-mannuronate) lyase
MKPTPRILFLIPAFALLGCPNSAPTAPPQQALAPPPPHITLHSPWDNLTITPSAQPYDCGALILINPDITITSSQNNLAPEVRSAIYSESDVSLHDLSRRSIDAADNFLRTGSRAAAACVLSQLATSAQRHAMAGYMADADAWQEQNMALRSVAIAFLKVRRAASPQDAALINAWLTDIARQERTHEETGRCTPNNCELWTHRGLGVAMAAAAIGIAADDHDLFAWAVAQYTAAVKAIDDRGMLHYDTRGAYALKYNISSAAELVQIAELGAANGLPLYDEDDSRIHLLVHTVTRALIDPGPFAAAAGEDQHMPKKMETWEISWAANYNQRFPDPLITQLLQQASPAGTDFWGGNLSLNTPPPLTR